MEILELKITIFENLKIHWMGLTKRKRKKKEKEESENLKREQWKLVILKNREKIFYKWTAPQWNMAKCENIYH